ncbi:MAG TPA: MotA/TolQ/ExbB proton channel family protein [Steroidobacteraceae bacterium]|nr:MotA/TolQ/ExbB proton channel family protein [Steroidobacteraceae bacterium]
MKIPRLAIAILLLAPLGLSIAFAAAPAAPASLDDLLEQTRTVREREAKLNQQREATFLAERNKQAALMSEARAELAEQQRRSSMLTSTFDANEKRLTDMQQQLDARTGNLGEMFGVVRQVANDFSSVASNSIITAQYPGRAGFVSKLAQSKNLPSIQDLERFWFELQREMTESGKVSKYKTKVISPEGKPVDAVVTRIGPFSATSGGEYLNYLPGQEQLTIMARQPGSGFESTARDLEKTATGYSKGVVDPTRGVLLSIYAQRPTLLERIDRGEAVGYVIILVGIVGFGLGAYQLFYLATVRGRVRNQLKFPNDPGKDNPLGRVLNTFKGTETEKLDQTAEVVELRISEAVLKEVPVLERYQSFLKLAVAAGPLLGLIGTVIGMILTFQSITESGSSDPKLMAAGISQAMIATVLGLSIAIPLLFMNAWLTSMSKSIVQVLDEQSAGLLAERLEAMDHA